MNRCRALGLAVASMLLVASCGGDGGGDGAGATSAPETTEPAPASNGEPTGAEPSDPALTARAEAAVLGLDDLPEGWKEQDPEGGLDLEATWQDLMSCLGVDSPEPPLGLATSPTFLRGMGTQVRSTVEYMPESRAQEIAAALEGPELEECATEAFEADVARSVPEGGVPGPVEVSPLELPDLGGSTFATRVNVTINLEGLEVPIFQDLVVVFDGEAVSRLVFLDLGGAFPPELQAHAGGDGGRPRCLIQMRIASSQLGRTVCSRHRMVWSMSIIPPGSVCEKCDHGVHSNEEGRVCCDGCERPTPYCECNSDS